ncbi:hypothetical protein [Leyella stercorea]|uniref:hypothetical protein n=1 Tax=Leyella stercorea TaxID=363265 RepID=UPI00243032B6|nr:hypothetical protein [Leyella stercorea]
METSSNINSRIAGIKLRQHRNNTPAAPEQNFGSTGTKLQCHRNNTSVPPEQQKAALEQHSSCAGVLQFVAYALGKFYFDFAYVLGKFMSDFAYVLGKFYFGFAYVLGSKLVDGR